MTKHKKAKEFAWAGIYTAWVAVWSVNAHCLLYESLFLQYEEDVIRQFGAMQSGFLALLGVVLMFYLNRKLFRKYRAVALVYSFTSSHPALIGLLLLYIELGIGKY